MDLVQMTVERLQQSGTVSVPVYSRKPPGKVDQTGELFAVVRDAGTWGSTQHHTRQRRVVRVDLYADCERDEHGLPVADDAAVRAWAAWDGIDTVLHDLGHSWNAIVSSVRADEPDEHPIQGAEHSALLSGTYEVSA